MSPPTPQPLGDPQEIGNADLPMEFAPANSTATPEELKARIEAGIPEATATVTGDGHHFDAVVVSPAFRGLSRLAQHRLVHEVFGPELGGRIHALSIQTRTE